MVEIIGENMEPVFNAMGIVPDVTFHKRNFWEFEDFYVWRLTDDEYGMLEHQSDEDFQSAASEDTWWRYSSGSNLGAPNEEFTIAGEQVLAWINEDIIEDLARDFELLDDEEQSEYADVEDYCAYWAKREYEDVFEYCCDELGCSTIHNVLAVVTDIAKYNDMTIAEVFEKLGGV